MDTALMKTLVTHFYDEQKSTVIKFGFVPYVVYLISILYVFIGRLTSEATHATDSTMTSAIIYCIAVLSTGYFAYLELRQASQLKQHYIKLFNILDLVSIGLNVYLLTDQWSDGSMESFKQDLRILAICIMWVNLIMWLKVFEATTIFIRLIKDTMYDMRWFFFLYLVIVVWFSSMLYTINVRKNSLYRDGVYDDDITGYRGLNVLLHQYLNTLGDFSLDGYLKESEDDIPLELIIFFAGTFFINIIIFNMLIAIMGDTYDNVYAFKPKLTLVLKTEVMNDFGFLLKKIEKVKYLFVATLANDEND